MILTVTGCNGNIGRRVVLAALNSGHTVRGVDTSAIPLDAKYLDDTNFSFYELDLRDYSTTLLDIMRGSDAIIHLAAIPTPTDYLVNSHNTYVSTNHSTQEISTDRACSNVVISWNILRAAAEVSQLTTYR